VVEHFISLLFVCTKSVSDVRWLSGGMDVLERKFVQERERISVLNLFCRYVVVKRRRRRRLVWLLCP